MELEAERVVLILPIRRWNRPKNAQLHNTDFQGCTGSGLNWIFGRFFLLDICYSARPNTRNLAKYTLKNEFPPEFRAFNYQIQYTAVSTGISLVSSSAYIFLMLIVIFLDMYSDRSHSLVVFFHITTKKNF